jgi:acetoin utilization deacetylase AcuC-like enzyme
VAAGYYCIDTFTPINKNAYLAAKRAVDCVLTASQKLLEDHPLSYALVRPPGIIQKKRFLADSAISTMWRLLLIS